MKELVPDEWDVMNHDGESDNNTLYDDDVELSNLPTEQDNDQQ